MSFIFSPLFVKDVCPEWKDRHDVLALLRSCNYNVDACVNAYHCTVGKHPLPTPQPTPAPIDLTPYEEKIAELSESLAQAVGLHAFRLSSCLLE